MKRIKSQLFSNGTEFMSWTAHNCDLCCKQSRYNEKKDSYSQFRCSIDKEIQMQAAGIPDDGTVSVKSAEAVAKSTCPYLQTDRKTKTHRPIKNQQTLEFA